MKRRTVTFWNGWQSKEPTLGKWLYLWFYSDRWRYQERDRVTHFWQFKVCKWCDVWQHTRTRGHPLLYVLTLRMSASGVQTWEAAEKSLLLFQQTCVVPYVVQYNIYDLEHYRSLLTGELYSFTIWANTDKSTVLLNSECVVSPSKTVLPIAPPSSGLTTVNHCVHTHRQFAKSVISIFLRKEESLCMLNNDVTEYKSLFKSTFSTFLLGSQLKRWRQYSFKC